MNLRSHGTPLAIVRLPSSQSIPPWATSSSFFSVTRTPFEVSIVCPESCVPADVRTECGWVSIEVEGPLDFGASGVLSSLCAPLADAGISIFAISTFDTDYLLVKLNKLELAEEVLRAAGHVVSRSLP